MWINNEDVSTEKLSRRVSYLKLPQHNSLRIEEKFMFMFTSLVSAEFYRELKNETFQRWLSFRFAQER